MLRVKISTLGRLATNWNVLVLIICILGLGNERAIGGESDKGSGIIMKVGIVD